MDDLLQCVDDGMEFEPAELGPLGASVLTSSLATRWRTSHQQIRSRSCWRRLSSP